MARLSLSLLGTFQATLHDRPITAFASDKVRALLAYLAVEADRPHRREALAGLLWPDWPDASALTNLRNALSSLRKTIGDREAAAPVVLADRETIQFNSTGEVWVDVHTFRALIDPQQPVDCLDQGIALYRGPLLEGFCLKDSAPFEEWLQVAREQLQRPYLAALARLAAYHEQRGDLDKAREAAWKQVDQAPWLEEAHRQLMRLLALSGQRGVALVQYETCRRVLQAELGVGPAPETVALYERIRDDVFPEKTKVQAPGAPSSVRPPDQPRHNLPAPLSSFVGREKEIAEVKQLLIGTGGSALTPSPPSLTGKGESEGVRLLTLTGAGGCGKTRLALQVATDLAGRDVLPGRDVPPERLYQHGVWWVELAALSDPALVPKQVAQVFELPEAPGVPITTTLANYFRTKEALLVLDNCEHLIEACAQLAETLLSACPDLHLLVTSREAFGLTGEVIWRVPSLDSPDAQPLPPPESLAQYDAIRLLTERAQAVAPQWQLTDHAQAAARICCQLDGIPLAIELAAARLKVLSAEQVAERLDDRFQLLTGGSRTALPRHRTLRATLDWSYDLLSDEERALFQRLAVFAGGWTLEAAEYVCAGKDSDVLDVLTRLVDKSIVMVEQDQDERRYRMLETIRQYAHEKLAESGKLLPMRHRHLDYFLKLGEEARPHALDGDPTWLDRLETEHDNLRAALEHALAQNPESALRLAMSLEWFWAWHDHVKEGATYAMRLLPLTEAWGPGTLRARALGLAGSLAGDVPGDTSARALSEASLEMARAAGDEYQIAWSLYDLAALSLRAGDWAQMRVYTEESLVLFQELGIAWGTGNAFWQLGHAAYCNGETEAARSLFEQSLEWTRKNNLWGGMTFALNSLGELARLRDDYTSAEALYAECAQLQRRMRHTIRLAGSLINLGQVALHEGDHIQARAHFEEALAIYRRLERTDCFVIALAGLAGVAGVAGKHQPSARLFGAAEAIYKALGRKMGIAVRAEYDRIIARVRAQLDEATFDAAWEAGRKMTLEQAVEYALGESGQ